MFTCDTYKDADVVVTCSHLAVVRGSSQLQWLMLRNSAVLVVRELTERTASSVDN